MSDTIITPALVRRYLKATGRPCTAEWPALMEHIRRGNVANDLDMTREDFGVRLGLCAAAGRLAAAVAENFAPGEEEQLVNFIHGEIRGLLRMAGVDPAAWEAAR